jgi:hypothetical protein
VLSGASRDRQPDLSRTDRSGRWERRTRRSGTGDGPSEWWARGSGGGRGVPRAPRAIHAHVKALIIHPDRVTDVVTTSPGDPSALAAARIARGLIRFAYLPGLMRYAAEGPATAWVAAKTSLDAATDLLTTYRNVDGVIRTPDALQLQDPAYRGTALAGIGNLTSAVLEAEEELSERAAESGMAHADLERLLPDLRPLQRRLHALTGLANE